MTSMTAAAVRVTGGIDTHKDLHMAAVVDRDDGRLLAIKEFSTTRAGYRALLRWMRSHGEVVGVGIEGTGSYGAGVTRFLTAAGITTFEVDRPDRTDRRRRGKSDPFDADMAQHAQLRIDAGLAIYFCDPQSPWQRGPNENTNGLLRQYFPKSTDLHRHSRDGSPL